LKLKVRRKRKRKRTRKAATTTTTIGRMAKRRQIRIISCPIRNHFIFPQCCHLTAEPPTNAPAGHLRLKTLLASFLRWTDLPYAMTIVPRTVT
jgi:hypothetical protein